MAALSSGFLTHQSGLKWPRRALVWLAAAALATTGVVGLSAGSISSGAPVGVNPSECPAPDPDAPVTADTIIQLEIESLSDTLEFDENAPPARARVRATVTNSNGPVTGLTACDLLWHVDTGTEEGDRSVRAEVGPIETWPGVYEYVLAFYDRLTYVVTVEYPAGNAGATLPHRVWFGLGPGRCLIDWDATDYNLDLEVGFLNDAVTVWGSTGFVDPAEVVVTATISSSAGPVTGAIECGLEFRVTDSNGEYAYNFSRYEPVEESPGVYLFRLDSYETGTYYVDAILGYVPIGNRVPFTIQMVIADCWDTHSASPTQAAVSGPEAATVTVRHTMLVGRCQGDASFTEDYFQAHLPAGVNIAPGTFVNLGNGQYEHKVYASEPGQYWIYHDQVTFTPANGEGSCLIDPTATIFDIQLEFEVFTEAVTLWGTGFFEPAMIVLRATVSSPDGPVTGAIDCGLTLRVEGEADGYPYPVPVTDSYEAPFGVYYYHVPINEGGTYFAEAYFPYGPTHDRIDFEIGTVIADCWDTHTASPTRAAVSGPGGATVTVTHTVLVGRCIGDESLTEDYFQAQLPAGVNIASGTFVNLGNGQYEHKVYASEPGQYSIFDDQVTFTPANSFTQFIEVIRSIIARLMELVTRLLSLWS
jgi:hypothetical protein